MDFDIDPTVYSDIFEIVLFDDTLRDDGHGEVHVFESLQGCTQVEVPDIDAEEFGVFCGKDGVKEQL